MISAMMRGMSVCPSSAALVFPASACPGQTTTVGTRVPPSRSVYLPPENGADGVSFFSLYISRAPSSYPSYIAGPLSDVKMKRQSS